MRMSRILIKSGRCARSARVSRAKGLAPATVYTATGERRAPASEPGVSRTPVEPRQPEVQIAEPPGCGDMPKIRICGQGSETLIKTGAGLPKHGQPECLELVDTRRRRLAVEPGANDGAVAERATLITEQDRNSTQRAGCNQLLVGAADIAEPQLDAPPDEALLDGRQPRLADLRRRIAARELHLRPPKEDGDERLCMSPSP